MPFKRYIILFLLSILLSSCLTQRSLITPYSARAPKKLNPKYLMLAINIIINQSKFWTVQNSTVNSLYAEKCISNGKHTLTVKIQCKERTYTITYYNSYNLNYRESYWSDTPSIHHVYNYSVKSLIRKIQKQLPIIAEQIKAEKLQAQQLDNFIGKTSGTIIDQLGPPDAVNGDGRGGKILTYQMEVRKNPIKTWGTIRFSLWHPQAKASFNQNSPYVYEDFVYFYINKHDKVYKWMRDTNTR
ncbi:MAG: hypothetical protein K9M56_04410 [Victivallales bacterium]|nr:hypothetical protein [Victivallales bacterium]